MNYFTPAKGKVRPLFSCLCDKMLVRNSEKPLSVATSVPERIIWVGRSWYMVSFQPLHVGAWDGSSDCVLFPGGSLACSRLAGGRLPFALLSFSLALVLLHESSSDCHSARRCPSRSAVAGCLTCCLNSGTGSVTTERRTERAEGLRAAWRQDERVLWSPGLSQEQAVWFWYSGPSTHWEQAAKRKAKIRHRPTLHFFYWSSLKLKGSTLVLLLELSFPFL